MSQLPSNLIPPHNIEAEQAILGSCLQKSIAISESLNIISKDDFYSPAHREIFGVIESLFMDNRPADLVTVVSELKERDRLDGAGGPAYIATLTSIPPSVSRVAAYCDIVKDKAKARRLIEVSSEVIDDCYNGMNTKETIDELGRKFFEIAVDRNSGAEIIKSIGDEVVAEIEKRYKDKKKIIGIPSGFFVLDRLLGGFMDTDLIIIAGRPSMGKTTFALNIMNKAVSYGYPTLFFSLEMGKKKIGRKHLSMLSRVDGNRLKSGHLSEEDWPKISRAQSEMKEQKLYIDDSPALSITQIRARSRLVANRFGVKLIVVDYLGLCRATAESREREVAEVSAGLKSLAKELDVPVIALSQLNRKLENRTDKKPIMADLRDSGAIEQDADVIMFVYRDEVYNKASDNPKKGIAEIIVAKNRDGETGSTNLCFIGEFSKFEELSDRNE